VIVGLELFGITVACFLAWLTWSTLREIQRGYFLGQANFYSGRIRPWIILFGFLFGFSIFNYGLYLIVKD
jgi:hypothetical protein